MQKKHKPGKEFLPLLSAPARRALENKQITSLQKLANYSEAEILQLHGMGKSALPVLRAALKKEKLFFKKETHKTSVEVDTYISRFPPATQKLLRQMRSIIRKNAPGAEELISYGMPAYKLHGMLVWFAGYEKHIGLYPKSSGVEAFKDKLSGYKYAKGSIQFPLGKPLPVTLIAQIVKYRVKENLSHSK
jgi:uncharacterized protein YdhG (YjbR/CyaY superfamily)